MIKNTRSSIAIPAIFLKKWSNKNRSPIVCSANFRFRLKLNVFELTLENIGEFPLKFSLTSGAVCCGDIVGPAIEFASLGEKSIVHAKGFGLTPLTCAKCCNCALVTGL